MGQAINIFVAVLLYAATILVLIATVLAAYAAFKSYFVTRSVLYYQLLARYSSSEMGKALGIMWDLFCVRRDDCTKKEFLDMLKDYRVWRKKQNTFERFEKLIKDRKGKTFIFAHDCNEIDEARRLLSHFFTTAYEMCTDMRVLDKACFKKICGMKSFKLLYYVVEWFELANNPDRDRKEYTDLLHNSGLPRKMIEDLESARPPETWDDVTTLHELKPSIKESEQSKPNI